MDLPKTAHGFLKGVRECHLLFQNLGIQPSFSGGAVKKNPTFWGTPLNNWIGGPVTVGDITGDFYQKWDMHFFHTPIETRCSFFFQTPKTKKDARVPKQDSPSDDYYPF